MHSLVSLLFFPVSQWFVWAFFKKALQIFGLYSMVSDFVLWAFWCVNVSVSLSLYVFCALSLALLCVWGRFSSGLLFLLLS